MTSNEGRVRHFINALPQNIFHPQVSNEDSCLIKPLPSKCIQVSDYATHQDLASWSDDKFRPAASPGPLWGRSAGRDQAFLMRPSCVRAVIPSSSPTSSRILPSFSLSTVVPVKCIFRLVANGNDPIRKSLKAGPVCVPPPSHCPTT